MNIRFSGGLGNQMFQYAFYEALKAKFPNKEILCDIGDYSRCEHHYGYELERIFHLDLPYCTENESKQHLIKMTLSYRILRKIGIKNIGYPERYIDREQGYRPQVWSEAENEDLLWGWWQDERYFDEVKEKVRTSLSFPAFDDEKNISVQKQMRESNSVSLHVRRGDYLTSSGYVDLCSSDYYFKAARFFREEEKHLHWFVFSDDLAWCKENLYLPDNDVTYVNWNNGMNSYKDMQLMTNCKFHIIANSTFSWWGAWLADQGGITVCPKEFRVGTEEYNRGIICHDWIPV